MSKQKAKNTKEAMVKLDEIEKKILEAKKELNNSSKAQKEEGFVDRVTALLEELWAKIVSLFSRLF